MHAALEFVLEQIRGAWRFRWTAMLVAWIVCAAGWLIVLALPDTYSAWARVYVGTRTRLNQLTQGIAVESNLASEAEAVREALLGGPQLEKVARLAIPDYSRAGVGQRAAIVDGLRRRLQVEVTGERNRPSDLYTITYTDPDRSTAAQVVDQLLTLFLSGALGGSQEGSEQAQQFLTQQVAEYDKKLAAAEGRLADFKRHNGGLVPGATGGDYFARLHAQTDELDKERLALTVAQQKREELQRQLSSGQLVPGSSQADVEVATARRQVADREAKIAELRKMINIPPEVEAEHARLNRDYEVIRGQYQTLVERLNRARPSDKAEATGVVRFEVVDPPTVSNRPVSPDRLRLIIVVLLGGLAAGIAVACLLHRLRPVFASARQLGELTQLPVLGVISMTWVERHQAQARRAVWAYSVGVGALIAVALLMLLTQSATSHFLHGLMA